MAGHLGTCELLALRDGVGTAGARAHLEACRVCAAELERLRQVQAALRALPSYSPPRDLWPRVERAVRRDRGRRTRFALGATGLAAAAVLSGLLVLRGPDAAGGGAPREPWVAEAASRDLGPMIERAWELESVLRAYEPGSRVYDAPTALAVSVLEDRILLLDRMLDEGRTVGADRAFLHGLWGDRVETLQTLVSLQAAQQERAWR